MFHVKGSQFIFFCNFDFFLGGGGIFRCYLIDFDGRITLLRDDERIVSRFGEQGRMVGRCRLGNGKAHGASFFSHFID